jgi:hypothetical protein
VIDWGAYLELPDIDVISLMTPERGRWANYVHPPTTSFRITNVMTANQNLLAEYEKSGAQH